MSRENIRYYLSRAEEEDRIAETLPIGAVRELHRELAAAYRERAAECRRKLLDPITEKRKVYPAATYLRSLAQATMEVAVIEPRDRQKLGDIEDHERALA